jgi:phosphatidate cytidylyltransferase
MAASPPSPEKGRAPRGQFLRVLSALVLAPLAILAVIVGGWPFILFWSVAAIGVYLEWSAVIVQAARPVQIAGAFVLAAAGALAAAGFPAAMLLVIAGGALALVALAESKKLWCAGGMLYAGLVLAGPIVLRRDLSSVQISCPAEFCSSSQSGTLALLFLFAVVWATDILAFWGGRLIGGPKLVPSISPQKTWSGAVAGALGGVGAGSAVAAAGSLANPLAVAGLALLLSLVAEAGDLLESAVKRRFGVKDSGRIIPGHGGLMDRLDGFLAAAGAAALIGATRGGLDGAAGGLLVW